MIEAVFQSETLQSDDDPGPHVTDVIQTFCYQNLCLQSVILVFIKAESHDSIRGIQPFLDGTLLRKRTTLAFSSFCPFKKKETKDYAMSTSNVHFITLWNERLHASLYSVPVINNNLHRAFQF